MPASCRCHMRTCGASLLLLLFAVSLCNFAGSTTGDTLGADAVVDDGPYLFTRTTQNKIQTSTGFVRTDVYTPQTTGSVAVWPLEMLPVVIYTHGRAPYGSSTENVALLEALAQSGYRVYAPNVPTTGSRDADYEKIADSILALMQHTMLYRNSETPVFLIGMSRGAGGMLTAIAKLARTNMDEGTYGRVTRAIAFAPRGSTVNRIIRAESWQRVTTPVIIVSPSNDNVTPQEDVAASFAQQEWPASTQDQNPLFYNHAGGSHFGYTNGRGAFLEPIFNVRQGLFFPVWTMPGWQQRAEQTTIALLYLRTGTLESCLMSENSDVSALPAENTCGGHCFKFLSWWEDRMCMSPCCVPLVVESSSEDNDVGTLALP